jgi:5'(3')-deoxyribonucleotidase
LIFNIDIDNTVNDFIENFVRYFNRITKSSLLVEDVVEYDLSKLGVDRETLTTLFFKNNYFYESMLPLKDSMEVINDLIHANHDVRFVTAIDYDVIQSRLDFIHHWFPLINTSKSLIITNDKKSIFADIVIDDLPDNLVNVNPDCLFILKKQPWNIDKYNEIMKNRLSESNTFVFDTWYSLRQLFKTIGVL